MRCARQDEASVVLQYRIALRERCCGLIFSVIARLPARTAGPTSGYVLAQHLRQQAHDSLTSFSWHFRSPLERLEQPMGASQSNRHGVAPGLAASPPGFGEDIFGARGATAFGAAAVSVERAAAGGVLVHAAVPVAVAVAPDQKRIPAERFRPAAS